jgi:hypothetical protein
MSQPWLDDDGADDAPTLPPPAPPTVDDYLNGADPNDDEAPEPDDIDEALPTILDAATGPVAAMERAIEANREQDTRTDALERQNLSAAELAERHLITDATTFAQAEELLKALAEAERRVHDFMDEDISRAHAAWKGLTEKRAGFLKPLEAARKTLGARYATFARQQAERDEAARRERELEAQRAEQERLAAEAAQLEAAAAEAPDPRQADRLAQEAAEVRQEAATVERPVLPVQRTVAPAKGISTRSNWTAQVDDKMALIRAVAEGKVSAEALEPNMVYLRQRAKADKSAFVAPGVRVYDAAGVSVRR